MTGDPELLGSDGAVGDLYRAHIAGAVRLGYLLTGDAATAQDLAHDAFLRAASRIGTMRDPARFRPYLHRAVVRQMLQQRRAEGREQVRLERAAGPQRVDDQPGQVGTRLDLVTALRSLPVRQRAAIVLRYWHDLPEAEIARVLGCRRGTVKSNLARGLAALRREVEPGG